MSLSQILGTGALVTCRSGFYGQNTSTGCLQQARPSRSWAARSCVPCPRSSSASVHPWVEMCCMPTWTSGSQVRHETAQAESLPAPGHYVNRASLGFGSVSLPLSPTAGMCHYEWLALIFFFKGKPFFRLGLLFIMKAVTVGQWIKVLASKPDNWSSIPGTSRIGEKGLSQIVPTSAHESWHPFALHLHSTVACLLLLLLLVVSGFCFFLFGILENSVLVHWVEAPSLRGLG